MRHLKSLLLGVLVFNLALVAWAQPQPLTVSGGESELVMEKIEIVVERIERGVVSFSTSVNNEIPGEVIPNPGNVRAGQLPDVKWKFSFTMPQPQEQSGRASRPLVFRFTIKPKHPEKFPLKKGASLVLNEEIKKFSASGAGNKNEVKFDFELIWKWEPGSGEIKSNKGAFIISPRMDSGSA